MAERFRGSFTRSAGSAELGRSLGRMKFGYGRQFVSNRVGEINIQAERIGFYVNEVLRRAAPDLRDRFIAERISKKVPIRQAARKNRAGGYIHMKDGLRKRSGRLQDSVRMTVTSPGTTANQFRGTFRLSSKVGGGQAWYALLHERSGLMKFGKFTLDRYARLINEIRAGVARIAAEFGATVS